MADRPNERMDDGMELPTDSENAPLADGRDGEPTKSRPPTRWVQLAYDLEQYDDADPNERGEVY